MRVVPAPTTGFCDGVKRAIAIALDAASRHGGLRTDAPVVHNQTVIDFLAGHGVSGHPEAPGLPLLIRAHGVPPERRRAWEERGETLVDATCVHVARNQRLAEEAARRDETVVIAGDRRHAEVEAVAGCAGESCRVVSSLAEAEEFVRETDPSGAVFLMAQTTFDTGLFAEMSRAISRLPGARVADTICRATHTRQREAGELARRPDVDAVVVVGGAASANTRRLADAVRAAGKPVFVVETAEELNGEDFREFSSVGLTSGASTPEWAIRGVEECLRKINDITK